MWVGVFWWLNKRAGCSSFQLLFRTQCHVKIHCSADSPNWRQLFVIWDSKQSKTWKSVLKKGATGSRLGGNLFKKMDRGEKMSAVRKKNYQKTRKWNRKCSRSKIEKFPDRKFLRSKIFENLLLKCNFFQNFDFSIFDFRFWKKLDFNSKFSKFWISKIFDLKFFRFSISKFFNFTFEFFDNFFS